MKKVLYMFVSMVLITSIVQAQERVYYANKPIYNINSSNVSQSADNPNTELPDYLLLHEMAISSKIQLYADHGPQRINIDGSPMYDNQNNAIWEYNAGDIQSGIADHYVMGKITAIRGGTSTWNRKWTVEVNTASAYNENRGSIMTYNESTRGEGGQSQIWLWLFT